MQERRKRKRDKWRSSWKVGATIVIRERVSCGRRLASIVAFSPTMLSCDPQMGDGVRADARSVTVVR